MKNLLEFLKGIKEFLISFFDLDSYSRLVKFLDTMPHEEKTACEEVLKNIKILDK